MFRIFKICLKYLAIGGVAFILLVALAQKIPTAIQSIITHTFSKHNLPVSLIVRHVGLWSSDFSGVSIGGDTEIASIDSVRIDYSPTSLWHQKLKRIVLSGIELNVVFKDGKLIFPWQKTQVSPTDPPPAKSANIDLLLNLGEVTIDKAIVSIRHDKASLSLPCTLSMQPSATNSKLLLLNAKIRLLDQNLSIASEINLDTYEVQTTSSIQSIDLARFADFLQINNKLSISGLLGVDLKANIDLNQLQLLSSNISGIINDFDTKFGNTTISSTSGQENLPFYFSLTTNKNSAHFTTNHLSSSGYIDTEFGNVDLSLEKSEDDYSFQGNISFIVPQQTTTTSLSVGSVELIANMNGEVNTNGNWTIELTPQKENLPLSLTHRDLDLSTRIQRYIIQGSHNGGKSLYSYNLNLTETTIRTGTINGQLSDISVQGKTENGQSEFVVPFKGLTIQDSTSNLSATANGEIPFSVPNNQNTRQGKIYFQNILLADKKIGSADIAITQGQHGIHFRANHDSAIINDFCLNLEGSAQFLSTEPQAEIFLKNGCNTVLNNVDLSKISPELSGYFMDAKLDINGNFMYDSGKFSGTLDFLADTINFSSTIKDFSLKGGTLKAHFSELPRVKTDPKQIFSFQQVSVGKLVADSGLVEFQIESPESIFIEKGQFQWSDGHVYTQALRFSPTVKDYDFIFYCDHLHFATLLDQLGAANAAGDGRVNGRVPVRITEGKFFLENGFLYSTPGDGGNIKLSNTEILTQSIPENTPQFSQIDLAREALKDFSYDWTKLDIKSESQDNILLHLQINGKPSQPLPFVYNKEFGGFARVDASSPGSRFQGIKLDVNFRLPLNQVLHYGDSIKSLID